MENLNAFKDYCRGYHAQNYFTKKSLVILLKNYTSLKTVFFIKYGLYSHKYILCPFLDKTIANISSSVLIRNGMKFYVRHKEKNA